MKRFLTIILISTFLSQLLYAQLNLTNAKLHLWIADNLKSYPNSFNFSNQPVNVVFSNDMQITSKNTSKSATTIPQMYKDIMIVLINSFPSAHFIRLDSTRFFTEAPKDSITIKISIFSFFEGSKKDIERVMGNPGNDLQWSNPLTPDDNNLNESVGYLVKIFDYRNGKNNKYVKSIAINNYTRVIYFYNTANTTINTANKQLVDFILNSLME